MYGLPVHGQRTKTNAKTCKKFNKINQIKSKQTHHIILLKKNIRTHKIQ